MVGNSQTFPKVLHSSETHEHSKGITFVGNSRTFPKPVARAANCPRFTQDDFPGRIKYRKRGSRAVFKCPKKFNRYGSRFATCQSDGTWSNEPPLCTKTGCVPLDPSQVTNLEMDVKNGAVVKFSCLNDYILIGVTLAYCNGKDWSAPLPRCAAPHELTECDFEEDLCGWTQDENEEQDWTRNVGSTQTGNTGPKHDHTLGDTGLGHYLYFETSNPTMTGHQANLLSPMYTEDLSPLCFDFWYHILGPDEKGHVGSLEVFVLDQSQYIDDDDVHPIFYIDGNQGDQWHRGVISIEKQDEPYQIAIVATRALSYISDIAIDDVRLFNCTKSTTSPPVSSPQSSPKTMTGSTSTTDSVETTVITKKTETTSPTTIKTQRTVTTKTPTGTTVKKETTESSTPKVPNTSTSASNQPITSTTESTTVVKVSSTSSATSPNVASSTKTEATSKVTKEHQSSQNTPSKTKPLTETTRTEKKTTETTEEVKTSATSTPTIVSSSSTMKSTSSAKSSTKSPMTSATEASTTTTASSSTSIPSQKQTSSSRSSSKTSNGPSTKSQQTSTSSVKTTVSSTQGRYTSSTTTESTTSTSISSSRSTSSSVSSTSSSSLSSTTLSRSSSSGSTSSSSSSRFTSTSRSSNTNTDDDRTVKTQRPKTTISDTTTTKETTNTNNKVTGTETSSKADKTVKPTKRTNEITTKPTEKTNGSKDNTVTVSEGISQHPGDDTLKPLMIGLCVGIVAGLIIIGVIAYVCVRRRKFYTSQHEDELKPITNSASLQSLNNGHFYQDEEYESES